MEFENLKLKTQNAIESVISKTTPVGFLSIFHFFLIFKNFRIVTTKKKNSHTNGFDAFCIAVIFPRVILETKHFGEMSHFRNELKNKTKKTALQRICATSGVTHSYYTL